MNKNKKPAQKRKPGFKKVSVLEQQGVNYIDYKDVDLLNRYISVTGKIIPRRITNTSVKHQRMIANAIKRARIVALIPFTKE